MKAYLCGPWSGGMMAFFELRERYCKRQCGIYSCGDSAVRHRNGPCTACPCKGFRQVHSGQKDFEPQEVSA